MKVNKAIKRVFQLSLSLFILYNVIQSTGMHLAISNMIIILYVFIISCIYGLSEMKTRNINIFKKNDIYKLINKLDIIMIFFMIINTCMLLLVPIFKGRSIGTAIEEAGMLLMLILYFPLALLIKLDCIEIKKYMNIFVFGCVITSVWYIGMWLFETIHPGSYLSFISFLLHETFGIVEAEMPLRGWGMVRIIQSNALLLGVGIILSFYNLKNIILKIFVYALLTFAILVTFLKSLWLSLVTAILLIFISNLIKKRDLKNTFILVGTLSLTVLILNFTVFDNAVFGRIKNTFAISESKDNAVNENNEIQNEIPENNEVDISGEVENNEQLSKEKIENTKESTTENSSNNENEEISNYDASKDIEGSTISNDLRKEQSVLLIQRWLESPIIGWGYGGYVEGYSRVANVPNHWQFEMTSISLLMKIGIIGMLIWIIALCYCIYIIMINGSRTEKVAYISILLLFLLTIQTNPLLFTPNGISIVLYLLLFSASVLVRYKKDLIL